MNLRSLVEKSSDADALRDMIAFAADRRGAGREQHRRADSLDFWPAAED